MSLTASRSLSPARSERSCGPSPMSYREPVDAATFCPFDRSDQNIKIYRNSSPRPVAICKAISRPCTVSCLDEQQRRVRTRVRTCLRELHLTAVRCSLESLYLQAISVRRHSLQFVRAAFNPTFAGSIPSRPHLDRRVRVLLGATYWTVRGPCRGPAGSCRPY